MKNKQVSYRKEVAEGLKAIDDAYFKFCSKCSCQAKYVVDDIYYCGRCLPRKKWNAMMIKKQQAKGRLR